MPTCDKSGKKLLSGPQRMYSMPSKPWMSSRYPPVWPIMMLESTYAGYDGSCGLAQIRQMLAHGAGSASTAKPSG